MLREVTYMPNKSVLKYTFVPRKNYKNVKHRCNFDKRIRFNSLKLKFFEKKYIGLK